MACEKTNPSIDEMRRYLLLRDMDFPRTSRVKEKDQIEFLYYRQKANEVLKRYKMSEWAQLLKNMQAADASGDE